MSRKVGMLMHLHNLISCSAKLTIYKSSILPYHTYCHLQWCQLTLPLFAGDLRFFASSPALPLWYINLPLFTSTINIEYSVKNKTDLVWDLAHFKLRTWIFLICSTVSGAFLPLTKIISSIRILIVCTSCKTSYNVLGHSHWELSQFSGGGGRWNSRGGKTVSWF